MAETQKESKTSFQWKETVMPKIDVYLELWEFLRSYGLKTIQVIDSADAWSYRVTPLEFCVKDTFRHTIQSIYEDAGNWFLNDTTLFTPSENPAADLNKAINRMVQAIKDFQDADLGRKFTFQWGEETTIGGAIRQNLFHAIGHFSQLRNWVGLRQRQGSKQTNKT